jgi:hypothetical protein
MQKTGYIMYPVLANELETEKDRVLPDLFLPCIRIVAAINSAKKSLSVFVG